MGDKLSKKYIHYQLIYKLNVQFSLIVYRETDFMSYLARSSDSNTGFGIVVPAIPV